jgi:hypothetical protein
MRDHPHLQAALLDILIKLEQPKPLTETLKVPQILIKDIGPAFHQGNNAWPEPPFHCIEQWGLSFIIFMIDIWPKTLLMVDCDQIPIQNRKMQWRFKLMVIVKNQPWTVFQKTDHGRKFATA